MQYKETFINPFTDFGFKKLFGEEDSKIYLIAFLNSILPPYHQIEDLEYAKNEYQGLNEYDRRAIVDISCKTKNGETIIVELQKEKQNYFKDRSVYYSTFPIARQAQKGEWNYKLKPVYMIGILDFTFNEEKNDKVVIHTVQLKNQANAIFYDKLIFIYITLPNFNKSLEELNNNQDKWLYLFKHLAKLDQIPNIYNKDKTFHDLFEKAKVAKFSEQEFDIYQQSLKEYLDLYNVLRTAREEGRAEGISKGRAEGRIEGRLEGIIENAKKMKEDNLPVEIIAKYTGLSIDEINAIFADLK